MEADCLGFSERAEETGPGIVNRSTREQRDMAGWEASKAIDRTPFSTAFVWVSVRRASRRSLPASLQAGSPCPAMPRRAPGASLVLL